MDEGRKEGGCVREGMGDGVSGQGREGTRAPEKKNEGV